MKVPKRYNYMEVYLTYRCNLHCSYCINGKTATVAQLTPEEWAKLLNRIDYNGLRLTIGGGEPTVYRGFYDLMDMLRSDIAVDLLTNGQFDPGEFISKTTPDRFARKEEADEYKNIRVSYHVGQTDPERLVRTCSVLQEAGYRVGIFGIGHPDNFAENMAMEEMARRRRLFFCVKEYLGEYGSGILGNYRYPDALGGVKRTCLCRTREVLVSPNGSVHRCHHDLYANKHKIGHLSDEDFQLDDDFRQCRSYGRCNPCDVKLKTNRHLQVGQCAVEIREVHDG